MDKPDPHVISVVLNWNNYRDSSRCLNTLLDQSYENHSIVFVDNNSSDRSGQKIETEYTNIEVLYNNENRGFCGGMNRGISYALNQGADYIWILNNDVLVKDCSVLLDLVSTMEDQDRVGILSPLIKSYPDTDSDWFCHGEIDWSSGNAIHHSNLPDDVTQCNGFVSDGYVPLCAALVKASIFEEIGMLQEKYFMYYEDVEFSARASSAGYDILTKLDTEVFHEETGSTGGEFSPTLSFYTARNRWLFYYRHFHKIPMRSFLFTYLVWVLDFIGAAVSAREWRSVYAYILGTIHGVLNRDHKGPYP